MPDLHRFVNAFWRVRYSEGITGYGTIYWTIARRDSRESLDLSRSSSEVPGCTQTPPFPPHVARSRRASAPLHVHRDVDADRHPRGVHRLAHADGYLPRHRYPRDLGDLELRRLAARGDGEAHRHQLRARAHHHGQ